MTTDITEIKVAIARLEERQKLQFDNLEAKVDGLGDKLDGFNSRLTNVEVKAGSLGGLAGAVMAVGVALVTSKLTGKA